MLSFRNKQITEKDIISACISLHPKALEKLYVWYSPFMKGICIRYLSDRDLAEDVLQEGFIKVFEKIPEFNWKGEGSLKAWVSRIMVNLCIDTLKSLKKFQHISIDSVGVYDDEYDDLEDSKSLYEIIKQQEISKESLLEILDELSENNKIVFNLYAIEQLKHKEIAEVLEITEQASRTRLKRARIELKEKLAIMCNHQIKTAVL